MQEDRKNVPPTLPQSNGRRMLRVWSPLLIKWGIGFVTMMVAAGICSYIYMSAHFEETMKAMENQDQMMNLYISITEVLLKAQTIVEGIAAFLTIPVMLFFFRRDRIREKAAGIVPNKKASIWKYSIALLFSLAMSLGLNNLIFISNLSGVSEEYAETMEMLYSPALPVQLICLGILIPICEELVFRGLLFKRLREQTSFLQAGVYSSIVFGLLHVNLVQMLYGFILGMMLAYLYEKYGSVIVPVLAHMVMNIFSVLATNYKLFDWQSEAFLRIGVITVVCAAVSSTMFILIQRIEEHPDEQSA